MIQNERFAISMNGFFLAGNGEFIKDPLKAILFVEMSQAVKQFFVIREFLGSEWAKNSWQVVPVKVDFPSKQLA